VTPAPLTRSIFDVLPDYKPNAAAAAAKFTATQGFVEIIAHRQSSSSIIRFCWVLAAWLLLAIDNGSDIKRCSET